MIDSRKKELLSIPMLACIVEFELQLEGAGILFLCASTYRDNECQAKLYAMGRTAPGFIVTKCAPGKSRHNDTLLGAPASNASDYYPLMAGKLCSDNTIADLAMWDRLGSIAEACGLEWGGHWGAPLRDRPHVQLGKTAYNLWLENKNTLEKNSLN